jgi:dihydrofolate synthase/folylpolyglutamate synthase
MNMHLPPGYQESLDYIYSFVDFSRTHQENLSPENFDLSRMRAFMGLLGSPQDDFPTIHIAGSKGKGSVSAFCASILQTGGYKVGLYTSPHLKDFEERMQINFLPIPREELVDYVTEIKKPVSKIPGLTTFEIMTGLAFLYFSRENVDLGVIEVGLGGRLDATNIITPLVSVITSLYLDHVSILGDSLDQIAFEKGGIIKSGVPIVCAPQDPKALNVIQSIASDNGSNLILVDEQYPYSILEKTLSGQEFQVSGVHNDEVQFRIPLIGDYQVTNAVVAIAAILELDANHFPLELSSIKVGLENTIWPGRFEVLRDSPPVIVDSAHNPASITRLRETLDDFFPDKGLILVFGISEDKQLDGMFSAILPRADCLVCVQADHPRAMDPSQLAIQASGRVPHIEVASSVGDGLEKALGLVDEDQIVLVAGSIFVAASARIAWFESF